MFSKLCIRYQLLLVESDEENLLRYCVLCMDAQTRGEYPSSQSPPTGSYLNILYVGISCGVGISNQFLMSRVGNLLSPLARAMRVARPNPAD